MTYWRNTSYLHSWALRSIPFTVDVAIESHTPVFLPWQMRQLSVGESTPTASERASSASWTFQHCISSLPPVKRCAWYLEWNLTWTGRPGKSFPVMTHNAVQFPCAIRVGSRITNPVYLTGNTVIFRSGMCSATPRNIYGRDYSLRDFSTGQNTSPSPCVECCTKEHPFLRDFCRPA